MEKSVPHKAHGLLREMCTAEIKLGTLPRQEGMIAGEASEGHGSPPVSPLSG